MSTPRIGSLFTGTGALDLAVMDVYGGEVVWHSQYEPPDKDGREDTNQYAAKILERHWPGVPNLGDINRIDWQRVLDEHGPIDILTGGFPCTDVSSAGQRAGLIEGTRSGLWRQMAHAISILKPKLVVIENVEGLLSANADRGLGLDAEALDEEAGAGRVLRALGAVLGDLATLGFDAEWVRVAASEVGAPHPRKRVFVLAWPAAADAPDFGHEWGGGARGWWPGSADGDLAAADADGRGLAGHGELPTGRDALRQRLRHDADRRDQAPANTERHGRQGQRSHAGQDPKRQAPTSVGCGPAGGGHPAADAESIGWGERRPEPAGFLRGPDAAVGGGAAADADSLRWRAEVLNLRPGQPDVDWGDYGPAIRRWERILGRPAPWPTDLRGRLVPVFSEWMMGLPDGWVTCTPGPEGMSPASLRNAMLKALGNGVVRLQAAAAIRLLHERAFADRPAVLAAA